MVLVSTAASVVASVMRLGALEQLLPYTGAAVARRKDWEENWPAKAHSLGEPVQRICTKGPTQEYKQPRGAEA